MKPIKLTFFADINFHIVYERKTVAYFWVTAIAAAGRQSADVMMMFPAAIFAAAGRPTTWLPFKIIMITYSLAAAESPVQTFARQQTRINSSLI